jgi:hypothetical protein
MMAASFFMNSIGSKSRVRLRADGRILVDLKTVWRDGTTQLLTPNPRSCSPLVDAESFRTQGAAVSRATRLCEMPCQ